jgi:hypothetical protein
MSGRQTLTLDEVADQYLPPGWIDGPRWLARRLNRGELKGVRMGRTWMMTQANVEFMLDKLSNEHRVVDSEPESKVTESKGISFAEALSPRSRSRLRTVTQ